MAERPGWRMAPTPGRTALVVVDMQNAFCRDEGSTALIGLDAGRLKAAVAPCRRLLEGARASGLPVIFTRYAYRADYADGGILVRYLVPALGRADHLAAGSWDAALLAEFAPRPAETVVDKNRPSAFYAPAMEAALARLDVDTLVVCGVTTSCCVESTVRDASQRDYKVFVARDAVAEMDQARHDASLATMGALFADLGSVDDILDALRGPASAVSAASAAPAAAP